jgi:competence protein CoiA
MIAKCGQVKIWHWAHKSRASCDPWWESETEWHRSWKNQFPTDWQEVVHIDQASGEKHVADVKLRFGLVIEFQHSPIEQMEVESREAFYGNMTWVVDGDRGSADPGYFSMGLSTVEPASFVPLAYYLEWWGRSRLLPNWAKATAPVCLDFGDEEALWRLVRFDVDESLGIVMPTTREWLVEACSNGEPIPSVAADENDPLTFRRQWVELHRSNSPGSQASASKSHQLQALAALYAKVSSDRQDVRPAGTRLAPGGQGQCREEGLSRCQGIRGRGRERPGRR